MIPKDITSKKELEKALEGNDSAFVLFYASWCPFSKRFLPIYEKHSSGSKNKCLRVMIDDLEDVCEKYSISVYPTVLFFKKGKVAKRLDGISGEGLNEKKLTDLMDSCGG